MRHVALPQGFFGTRARLGTGRVVQGLTQATQRQIGLLRQEQSLLIERPSHLARNIGPQPCHSPQQRGLAHPGLAANQQRRCLRQSETEFADQQCRSRGFDGQV